jgi:hypothetical protein
MESFYSDQIDKAAFYRHGLRNHIARYRMLSRKEWRERAEVKECIYYYMLNLRSADFLLNWVQDFPYDLDLFVTDVREV